MLLNIICLCLLSSCGAIDLDSQLKIVHDVVDKRASLAKSDPLDDQPIGVNIWLNLLFIISLDERRQILTTSGWIDLWWNDTRYAWNSSQYGGVEEIMVFQDKVWKPDIVVRNAVNTIRVVGSGTDFIKVHSRGYLEWSPANIYETNCEVDVQRFPFDTQTCYINVSSWMYYVNNLYLRPYGEGVVLRHYNGNSEWLLKTVRFEEAYYNFSQNYQNGVTFQLTLERHSTFYVFKLLLPTVLLSLLNAFVFAVPVESGERVSISVTTMLSLIVFLGYIGDITPNNSFHVPVIALFVILHLSLGALSIICNIFILKYHFSMTATRSHVKYSRRDTKHIDERQGEAGNERLKRNSFEVFCFRKLSGLFLDMIFFTAFILASLAVTLFAVLFMINI